MGRDEFSEVLLIGFVVSFIFCIVQASHIADRHILLLEFCLGLQDVALSSAPPKAWGYSA